jgi:glutamine amidotransferase-like uncharacterized protein
MNLDILAYVGEGAQFSWLISSLVENNATLSHGVRVIDSKNIVEDRNAFDRAAVLVMPGGADRPYCRALNGAGNQEIRRFVEGGGAYLGLCAGAYYAAERIVFDAGGPDPICAPRELAFFPGTARGPILDLGPRYDMTKRSASAAMIESENGDRFRAYYNGGCFFEGDDGADYRVLARYADIAGKPPAVVEINVGSGRVVLSGVHLELSPAMLDAELDGLTDGGDYRHIASALLETDAVRTRFWRDLLERCGVAVS